MQEKDFTSTLQRYLSGIATKEEEEQLSVFFDKSGDPLKDTSMHVHDKERLVAAFKASPRFGPLLATEQQKSRLAWLHPFRSWQAAASWLILFTGILSIWFISQKNGQAPTTLAWKELRSGTGQVLKAILPDSTEIILNANTSLRYHPDFVHNRTVQLSGEAYFNVHTSKENPFTIHTADSVITEVLGTAFNISSYPQNNFEKLTVLSGRVKIRKMDSVLGVLSQHQAIQLQRGTSKQAVLMDAGTNNETSWIKGEWNYDGMGLVEMKTLLFNHYGISVISTTGADKKIHTAANLNFNKRQSANEVVSVFCTVTGTHSKWITGKIVEIY